MYREQNMPDREGEPWADKEELRTDGYKRELDKSRRKLMEEGPKPVLSPGRQERQNRSAREALERLNRLPDRTSENKKTA